MSIPTNKKLYEQVKKEADAKYKKHGLYKSAWISKEYQKRGGKYKGIKGNSVSKWMKEEWIQVEPYVKEKKKVKCGVGDKGKACRPSKKLQGTTTTIQEVLKKHDKKDILKVVKAKQKDMSKRINWNKLTIK